MHCRKRKFGNCVTFHQCATFHQIQKKLSLYLYFFGPKHVFEKKGPKKSFRESNCIPNFCTDYFVAIFKIFRFFAILHDAAGSVKTTTHKGSSYCSDSPRLPSSCFFGHETGFFFCLYIKICFNNKSIGRLCHFKQKLQRF